MSDKYILDGHESVACDDLHQWGRWMQTADRIVAKSQVGPYRVSTVFLGLNHQYGDGPPLLFETMIFAKGTDLDEWQERCSTWTEAEAQHAKAEAVCRGALQ